MDDLYEMLGYAFLAWGAGFMPSFKILSWKKALEVAT